MTDTPHRAARLLAAASLIILLALPASVAAQTATYQVQRGDTWTSVARRLNVNMCALARANGHRRCSSVYRASARLMVGQTLDVPR